jgi:ribonuclease-3
MLSWYRKLLSRFAKNGELFSTIEEIIGKPPVDESFYRLAFRHSSASSSRGGLRTNNQRLEFLGDAILGAVVADFLYSRYPKSPEGFLTNMRSKIVSRKHLNHIALKLNLNKLIVKKTARGVQAKSIHGDTLEALIGAVYLDLGYDACHSFILNRIIESHVDLSAIEGRIASHKGAILEWGQKNKRKVRFELTGCYGKSHARQYEISLFIDGELTGTGKGSSKKRAEEDASRVAYKKMKNNELSDAPQTES